VAGPHLHSSKAVALHRDHFIEACKRANGKVV
jgi:hypothetical protein